jgi:TatD DNase family protein
LQTVFNNYLGVDIDSNKKTLSIANQYPGIIYLAIGYHPWSITLGEIEENLAFIEENIISCIALGEVRLDYKTKAKKKIQWEVFSRVLLIAKYSGRPVNVHSRFSYKRTHQMVREAGIVNAVFHWYSGSLDILDNIIEDGYFISATSALAYSPPHQAAIEHAPLERILIETGAPVEYQGKVSDLPIL